MMMALNIPTTTIASAISHRNTLVYTKNQHHITIQSVPQSTRQTGLYRISPTPKPSTRVCKCRTWKSDPWEPHIEGIHIFSDVLNQTKVTPLLLRRLSRPHWIPSTTPFYPFLGERTGGLAPAITLEQDEVGQL